MGIRKKFLKSKPVRTVTFNDPKQMGSGARQVHIVGDFNNRFPLATPMKRLKTGAISTTVNLVTGRS